MSYAGKRTRQERRTRQDAEKEAEENEIEKRVEESPLEELQGFGDVAVAGFTESGVSGMDI